MNILVTGAGGFIGTQVTAALLRRGHQVTAAVRNPAPFAARFPDVRCLQCDFAKDLSVEAWRPRLAKVDAVINTVGIIRETRKQRFDHLHTRTPVALFRACEEAGVRQVIQISALGADEGAETAYHRSKRAADDALATMDLDWVILRPSIVYGNGARSMALFGALAALPLTPLIGKGDQLIAPIHVDDLARAVLRCVEDGRGTRRRIDLAGPEAISFLQTCARLREWLGLGPLRPVHLPYRVAHWLARLGPLLGAELLNHDNLRMLRRGNYADATAIGEEFGFMPRSLDQVLRSQAAGTAQRWHLGLYFMPTLLRWSIAATWVVTGLVSAFVYPIEESYALLASVGISGALAPWSLYTAACLDIVLGVATLTRRWLRPALAIQFLVMLGYTALISTFLPEYWLHPFGPMLKNLPLAAAMLCLWIMERKYRWNT